MTIDDVAALAARPFHLKLGVDADVVLLEMPIMLTV